MTAEQTSDLRTALMTRIQDKRGDVTKYIQAADRKNKRLTNMAIVCGAVAAAMTAGPALGGKSLSNWFNDMFHTELPIWQLLCFVAMLCSLCATIATNLSKSTDTMTKLVQAQVCNAKLEGLLTQTELQDLDVKQGSEQFAKLITEVSFV
jgi:hypothetical protein